MSKPANTPSLIPDQLLNNTKKGGYILFLCADLPLGHAKGHLLHPELAQMLATKADPDFKFLVGPLANSKFARPAYAQ